MLAPETRIRDDYRAPVCADLQVLQERTLWRDRLVEGLIVNQFVRVEEYKRPTFEVKVDDPREALRESPLKFGIEGIEIRYAGH